MTESYWINSITVPSSTKICRHCGNVFHRPMEKDERTRQSITLWRRRVYCSSKCCTADPLYREKLRVSAKAGHYGTWMRGKKLKPETREKIAAANRGHSRSGWSLSDDTRSRMSLSRRGDKSSFWRGGKTSKNALIRSSYQYKNWRTAVFARDNFTCVDCGVRGGKLHADHIKPFALFPDLRLDISNGRTLCVPCHKKTPTYLKSGRKLVEAVHGITVEIIS
ncbi:MAG: HNH endonuclease [Patescibacteria group bacterium]